MSDLAFWGTLGYDSNSRQGEKARPTKARDSAHGHIKMFCQILIWRSQIQMALFKLLYRIIRQHNL